MSARQIAALLGSNPDNSSNNNNNQNLNRQQQQQQQQQPLSNSVVGTSVNVNVNVHPYTSAVVSLPLRYGNQQYQYPYQQYPSQNQHYQYQQQYQHPPLVSEQHQHQQAHPSMVGSNNSCTNANSIPPAMVPQVASQVEVEEAIDNYILPQSNPGYYAGMSTHQVAASLGLPAYRCNIPYQDEIIEMPPTTQVSPNKQPHPQPLQPDLVSSTSNDDKVVSTESKADSPQRDVQLTKLDEAIGFLRTLNLKEQHERKLLPEEVKQEDLPNCRPAGPLTGRIPCWIFNEPDPKKKERLLWQGPRAIECGKANRPLEDFQAMYMSIEEIKQLEAEVDGCWDYKQEILSEMAAPNDKNVTPNKEKWMEEVRQHKVLSKKSARITKLQQSYLNKNVRLQYFLNWQQSKTRMESITEFVKPKYRKIKVDSPSTTNAWPSISISLVALHDSTCIDSICFQVKKLKQICDGQDLCPLGSIKHYQQESKYDEEGDENVDEWTNILTKIEKDIVEVGQYTLPVVPGLEAETRIMEMEDYEPPDVDHIVLVYRWKRNKKISYHLRNKTFPKPKKSTMKALQCVFESNKLELLRSLLARHVRRYHRMLEKKLAEGDKFLDSDRFIEMHKLKEECIRLRMLRYKTIQNVLAYPKHDYELSQYQTRIRRTFDWDPSRSYWIKYRQLIIDQTTHPLERTSQPMNMYVGATETEWNAIMYMLRRCISLSPKRKAEQILIKEKVLDAQRRKLALLGVIIVQAKNCDLYIPPPADSKRVRKVYLKSEAVCIVTSQSYNRTPERKALIDAIANANYVSSASTLYDVVRRFENGESIIDDEWARGKQWYVPSKSTFNKQNITMPTSITSTEIMNVTGISFEYKRYDSAPKDTSSNINFKPDSSRRVGNIILRLTPVTFNQLELMESSCRVRPVKRPNNRLCPDISNPTHIDISAYIESLPPQHHVMEWRELNIWWRRLSDIERRTIWWLNPSIAPLCIPERHLNYGYDYSLVLSSTRRYGFRNGTETELPTESMRLGALRKTINARNKVCRMYFSAKEFPPPSPPTFEFCRTGEPEWIFDEDEDDHIHSYRSRKLGLVSDLMSLNYIYYNKKLLGGPVDVGYDPRPLVPTSRNLLAELGVELTLLYHELWSAQGEDQFKKEEKGSNEFETGNQYDPRKPKALRDTGNDSEALSKLIDYIRRKSSECGSPVICKRTREKNQRTFQCQACYRTGRDCISFDLRWDRFGFYIHILNSHGGEQTVGNMSHHPLCPHNLPEEISNNIRLVESLHECSVWGCKTVCAEKFCASHAVVEAKEECVECRRWFLYQCNSKRLRDQRCLHCLRGLGISDSWRPREHHRDSAGSDSESTDSESELREYLHRQWM